MKDRRKVVPLEPLVSVIVPVYNVRPFLREALDSLIGQTYQKLEILIIDDGSTDGSAAVCEEYRDRDPRFKVIRQNNRGLSGARNTGLEHMTGDLVAFLDSDDAFFPDMIRSMVEAMERDRADMSVCGFASFATEGRMDGISWRQVFVPPVREVLGRREALDAWIRELIDSHSWNKVYRRKLWETLRFPEGYVYEDVQTTCQVIGLAEHVVTVPKPLVRYRVRTGSISRSFSSKNLRDRLYAQRVAEQYVHERIPELFTPQQEAILQERNLRDMIAQWTRVPASDSALADELRLAVLRHKEALRGQKLAVSTRISCSLFHTSPRLLLPAALPVFLFFKETAATIRARQLR